MTINTKNKLVVRAEERDERDYPMPASSNMIVRRQRDGARLASR